MQTLARRMSLPSPSRSPESCRKPIRLSRHVADAHSHRGYWPGLAALTRHDVLTVVEPNYITRSPACRTRAATSSTDSAPQACEASRDYPTPHTPVAQRDL
jgi:hypothetical protein